jgi:signal peptidase II
MMPSLGNRIVLLVAIVATLGCDRITKQMAATTLAGLSSQSFLADTVRLEYVENAGGFLSLGADLPPGARTSVFTVGTGFGLLVLALFALRTSLREWPLVGLSLIVAGGASNWLDRVIRGSVIDFLNVGVGSLRTGVFNVADVAIMLGAAITLVAVFRSYQSPRAPAARADTPLP